MVDGRCETCDARSIASAAHKWEGIANDNLSSSSLGGGQQVYCCPNLVKGVDLNVR